MCGICGIYNYKSNEAVEKSLILAMTKRMLHRGPDDEGYYHGKEIMFGMRRLSIIDVEGGHQPIHNEDKSIWTVLNGEIYNFKELRKELEGKGHRFYTQSDAEVIVHSYEEWGDDCFPRFNGMYGMSVWDTKKKRLILARDPFGIKPLYYYNDGKRLIWGSEIKAILADSQILRKVNIQALDLFLTFRFVPSPFTMFEGIKKIQPGHRVIVENGIFYTKSPASFQPIIDNTLKERDYISMLQERLSAAVCRQMVSDVPIGTLLSGGVDSAAVLAIMSKASSNPINTFTVGFKHDDEVNELNEARFTANFFGAKHHEILIDDLDYIDCLYKVIGYLEEPIATTSVIPMYFVTKLAKDYVKVVLTGQGADETFCGYHRYYGERYGNLYRRIPISIQNLFLKNIIEALPRQERIKRAVRSIGNREISERFVQVYSVFNQKMKNMLWLHGHKQYIIDSKSIEIVDYWRNGLKELDPLIQMSTIDSRLSLADDLLIYGDKMSMINSIEARVPFLDHEFISVAESLPASMRINGFTRKYILKKVMAEWLPIEIIKRKKRGFETPMDHWFRKELSGYISDILLSDNSACKIYFHSKSINILINDHISGRQDNSRQLFCLLSFELWHKQYIDGQTYANEKN